VKGGLEFENGRAPAFAPRRQSALPQMGSRPVVSPRLVVPIAPAAPPPLPARSRAAGEHTPKDRGSAPRSAVAGAVIDRPTHKKPKKTPSQLGRCQDCVVGGSQPSLSRVAHPRVIVPISQRGVCRLATCSRQKKPVKYREGRSRDFSARRKNHHPADQPGWSHDRNRARLPPSSKIGSGNKRRRLAIRWAGPAVAWQGMRRVFCRNRPARLKRAGFAAGRKRRKTRLSREAGIPGPVLQNCAWEKKNQAPAQECGAPSGSRGAGPPKRRRLTTETTGSL